MFSSGESDWSAISHSHGVASDIPVLLEAVCGSDLITASEALGEIRYRVCYQGLSVNESTSHTVPVLASLVAERRTLLRSEVLGLLVVIRRASGAWRRSEELALPEHKDRYTHRIAWEIAVDRAFSDIAMDLAGLQDDADGPTASAATELIRVLQKAPGFNA